MKMSLDKSRIPKLSDSSRQLIPEKQRKAMNDPFNGKEHTNPDRHREECFRHNG